MQKAELDELSSAWGQEAVDFFRRVLEMSCKKRLTARLALEHPYLNVRD